LSNRAFVENIKLSFNLPIILIIIIGNKREYKLLRSINIIKTKEELF